MRIKTDIIPAKPQFCKLDEPHELDLKAICVFMALGFFLDQDSYWKDLKVLSPGTNYVLDQEQKIVSSESDFQWHYSPRSISFQQALNEFATLFEDIIHEQIGDKQVILPLSGGLDSRSQAAALKRLNKEVNSYSYEFRDGYPETKIAKAISRVCGFDYRSFIIERGYLWNVIDELAEINQCYSDFTNPRQMAIHQHLKSFEKI